MKDHWLWKSAYGKHCSSSAYFLLSISLLSSQFLPLISQTEAEKNPEHGQSHLNYALQLSQTSQSQISTKMAPKSFKR